MLGADTLAPTVIGAIRRFFLLFLAAVVLCAAAGAGYAFSQGPTASAESALVLADPSESGLFGQDTPSENYVADQVEILQLDVTLEKAARLLAESTGTELTVREFNEALTVTGREGTNLVEIIFMWDDPRVAQEATAALYKAYLAVLGDQAASDVEGNVASIDAAVLSVDQQISALRPNDPALIGLQETRSTLLARRAQSLAGDGAPTVDVKAYSPARTPELSRTSPVLSGALGALLGLAPAAVLCYARAQRRRRFGHRYDPEQVLQAPLLTEVPDFAEERLASDLPSLDAHESAAAEAFRFLSTALARKGDAIRVVAVASGSSLDGKTTVAANLAATAAQDGSRVLAVDADLAGRGLGFLLVGPEAGRGVGLAQVLGGAVDLEGAIFRGALGLSTLDLLSAGEEYGYSSDVVSPAAFARLISTVREEYDLIVLDVPPVLQIAYSAALLSTVDTTVVVVPHGAALPRAEELHERLVFLEVPVLGYVYNKAPLRRALGQQSRLVTDVSRRPRAATPADGPESGAQVRPAGSRRVVSPVETATGVRSHERHAWTQVPSDVSGEPRRNLVSELPEPAPRRAAGAPDSGTAEGRSWPS